MLVLISETGAALGGSARDHRDLLAGYARFAAARLLERRDPHNPRRMQAAAEAYDDMECLARRCGCPLTIDNPTRWVEARIKSTRSFIGNPTQREQIAMSGIQLAFAHDNFGRAA